MKISFTIALSIIAVIGILIHLYNYFSNSVVPKWSYGIFAISLFIVVLLNLVKLKSLKSSK